MDSGLVVIFAALAVLGLVAVVLLLRRGGGDAAATLAGRLDQMAKDQAATQAALAKALDDRLAELGKRVGDRLHEHTTQAQQSMTDLKERLAVIDAAQKNIAELSSQVVGLQDILANKQARGAFGEVQLENLVRDALPPSAYEFQATLRSKVRVDCLLKQPNGSAPIAVDAKFPLESYRALREAADEAALVPARRAFDAAIRKHIRDIAEKYIVPGETHEWAVMFLPSDSIFAELHGNFPGAIEDAHRRRIGIASPMTLMGLLITIRAVFRDVQMREQAGRIQVEVGLMLEDVRRLDDRVGNLQKHFGQVSDDVRQIHISTEGITRHAKRIEEVQLGEPGVAPPALAAVAGGRKGGEA